MERALRVQADRTMSNWKRNKVLLNQCDLVWLFLSAGEMSIEGFLDQDSLGHSVLRKFTEQAGVQGNFTVLDQGDTEDLIDLLRRQIRLTKDGRLPRKRAIAAIFSSMVNKVGPLRTLLNESYPQFVDERSALDALYKSFEAALSRFLESIPSAILPHASLSEEVEARSASSRSLWSQRYFPGHAP